MMQLKHSSDITWHDLPKIEDPFFAFSEARNAFQGISFDRVWGLDEWLRENQRYTREHQLRTLKQDLESATLCLVKDKPFSPVFKWVESGDGKGHWKLRGLHGLIGHSSFRFLLNTVRRPAMTSTGYRPPVETPLKESDASKWQDHNSQPVAATKNEEKTRILQDGLWKEDDLFNDVVAGKENKLYRKGNTTRPHSKGEEVKLIQKVLKKMDINIGEAGVDGIYGNDGYDAVMIFQENYEPTHNTHKYAWNKPDGIVGKNTLLAMDEALVAGWKYETPKVIWDKITIQRIKTLHPNIRKNAKNFILDAQEQNIYLRITSSYRSFEEQNALFHQGRTMKDGKYIKTGRTVTNAKVGESYHNYGLAIDVVEIKNTKALWENDWSKIGSIGKKHGFEWGGDWKSFKDKPHFQMTFGKTTNEFNKKVTNEEMDNGYVKL